MKKVAFKALGCRLNQYEIESLATEFSDAGYEIVPFENHADAYILNTCTVTNQSDQKSRNLIGKIMKDKHQDSLSVVTGCFATNSQMSLEKAYNIDYLVDNDRKSRIFDLVDGHFRGEVIALENLEKDLFRYKPSKHIFRTRSLIKIQDGCDNFCSFCIIPFVRGRAVSRSPQEILSDVRIALDAGYREIVITGVNIGRYAFEGQSFSKLIASILDVDDSFRLRISSIEPDPLDDEFIDLLSHPQLCPHLHICLQSGSERILLKMRRAYSYAQYDNLIEKIRAKRPDCNLTTDIMVGFPGETEEDFDRTLDAVTKIGFPHVHIFRYSIRNGTKAARQPDQVPEPIKKERSARLKEQADVNREIYFNSLIGKTQNILVENRGNSRITGYGEHYVPIRLDFEDNGEKQETNRFINARITGIDHHQDDSVLTAIPEKA